MEFGEKKNVLKNGYIPNISSTVEILLLIVLSVFMSSSIAFFIAAFGKTYKTYNSITSVLLTLIGFLAGIYLPIGALGETLKVILSILPITHISALLRQVFTKQSFHLAVSHGNIKFFSDLKEYLGINIHIGGLDITAITSLLYIFFITILLFILSEQKIAKSSKK